MAKPTARRSAAGSVDEPLCQGVRLFAGVNKTGRQYAGVRFGDEYGASCVVRRRHLTAWRRMLTPSAYATLEAFVDLYGG